MIYNKIHDEIVRICQDALTLSQVEIKLGLSSPNKGLRKYIKLKNILMPKYLGMKAASLMSNKTRKKFCKADLCENSLASTSTIKNFLFKNNLKKNECEECGWNKSRKDGKIPIELHHINGDQTDNRLSNLQILCPNCHSLTINYSGKNKCNKLRQIKQDQRKFYYYEAKNKCKICGKLGYGELYCSPECSGIGQRKVLDRPNKEELQEKISKYSWLAIGRMYGVSDNTIRKWAKSLGL